MILHFVNIISPANHVKQKLMGFFTDYSVDLYAMGFPDNWIELTIWKNTKNSATFENPK